MRNVGERLHLGRRLVLGAVAGALALVLMGSLLFGSAFAQSTPSVTNAATPEEGTGTDGQSTKTDLYQDFLGKLAANLGISDPATVDTALRTSLKQMVDEQQASGRLTAEQANALKERIDAGDIPGDFGRFARPGQDGMGMPGRGERGHGRAGERIAGARAALGAGIDDLATFFGESPDDLRAELKQGMSLADIAAAHGKSRDELKTFLMSQAETRIDTIIDAGLGSQSAPASSTPATSSTPAV